jgi:hypothetical protein
VASGLPSAGIEPHWPDGFRGYHVIAREIDECIELLAVITSESSVSTWQGIEVCLASSYPGAGWEGLTAPQPVFIYATTKLPGYVPDLDESPRPPLHLKAEPMRAVEQLAQHLGL